MVCIWNPRFAPFFVVLLLGACGGGSGGGSGNGQEGPSGGSGVTTPPAEVVPSYNGRMEPALLSDANAHIYFKSLVPHGVLRSQWMGLLGVGAASGLNADLAWNGSKPSCTSGSVHVAPDLAARTAGSRVFTFNQCVLGDETLTGKLTTTLSSFNAAAGRPASYAVEFSALSVRSSLRDQVASGRVVIEESAMVENRYGNWQISESMDVDLFDKLLNRSSRIEKLRTNRYRKIADGSFDVFEYIELGGRLYQQEYGYVDVSHSEKTPEGKDLPFLYAANEPFCLQNGLQLSGGQKSRIRTASIANVCSRSFIFLDENGDGTDDAVSVSRWVGVSAGNELAPTATVPAQDLPSLLNSTSVDGQENFNLSLFDYQNDDESFIRVEWWAEAAPFGATVRLGSPSGLTTKLYFDRPGRYDIKVRLRDSKHVGPPLTYTFRAGHGYLLQEQHELFGMTHLEGLAGALFLLREQPVDAYGVCTFTDVISGAGKCFRAFSKISAYVQSSDRMSLGLLMGKYFQTIRSAGYSDLAGGEVFELPEPLSAGALLLDDRLAGFVAGTAKSYFCNLSTKKCRQGVAARTYSSPLATIMYGTGRVTVVDPTTPDLVDTYTLSDTGLKHEGSYRLSEAGECGPMSIDDGGSLLYTGCGDFWQISATSGEPTYLGRLDLKQWRLKELYVHAAVRSGAKNEISVVASRDKWNQYEGYAVLLLLDGASLNIKEIHGMGLAQGDISQPSYKWNKIWLAASQVTGGRHFALAPLSGFSSRTHASYSWIN